MIRSSVSADGALVPRNKVLSLMSWMACYAMYLSLWVFSYVSQSHMQNMCVATNLVGKQTPSLIDGQTVHEVHTAPDVVPQFIKGGSA